MEDKDASVDSRTRGRIRIRTVHTPIQGTGIHMDIRMGGIRTDIPTEGDLVDLVMDSAVDLVTDSAVDLVMDSAVDLEGRWVAEFSLMTTVKHPVRKMSNTPRY